MTTGVVNPHQLIACGVIGLDSRSKIPLRESDIQPNGVDFRIDRIFELAEEPFVISDDSKTHRQSKEITPDDDGFFRLQPGRQYDIISNLSIDLAGATSYMSLIQGRSTFTRNGFILASGVYDTGFRGTIGTVLHTPMSFKLHKIERGVALGQVVTFHAETITSYNGQYQDTTGNWREQVKK